MEAKKYWLKLEEGFLDSGHIKVLKSKENGKELILFYLAIMLKSIRDEGHLMFSATIPYDEEMLAAVTDTDIGIVKTATAMLKELGLIEIVDGGIMYLTDIPRRTGKESDSAQRMREHRKRLLSQCDGTFAQSDANIEKDEEIDVKEEKSKKKRKTAPPGSKALDSIISSYTSDESLVLAIREFIKMRTLKKKPLTDTAFKKILAELDTLASTTQGKAEILSRSANNGWTGIYALTEPPRPQERASQAKKQINYDEE